MTRLSAHLCKPLACVVLASLTACAGPQALTSQVSSYGSWPEGRKPGRYVFERLPSQQAQPDMQDKLEAAAQPALATAGFQLVPEADKADVTVQVGSRVRIEQRARYYDPFWGPYGPYGPWHPGVGGWWGGGGRGGVAFSMTMEPPYVQMTVDLLIRDRKGNQVLYETHARYDRLGAADDRLLPYLFEAAMKDFPLQAVSPREVTVTIPAEDR
ncbi:DUF4136 domain-containing protein [Aquabacterium sp. NJ1]|uniref:DUF4136 domain-containing protein n=1 Tax=Aquabacterium sp. NJ1 TaxID=1538295 RepID=UPI00069115B5|nr:DUF4136 domain-containing protein [Aquabacterium sp. NJ1]